jgi:hypothetical protein
MTNSFSSSFFFFFGVTKPDKKWLILNQFILIKYTSKHVLLVVIFIFNLQIHSFKIQYDIILLQTLQDITAFMIKQSKIK